MTRFGAPMPRQRSIASTILLSTTLLSACASERINSTTMHLESNLHSVQYDQIRLQLARSIDNDYSIPGFMLVGSGVVLTKDSVSAKGSFQIVGDAFSQTTRTGDFSLAAADTQVSYNFVAITAPRAMMQSRDVFAYAVRSTDDRWMPYFDSFSAKPPRRQWLYWIDSAGKNNNPPPENSVLLGNVGRFSIYASSLKDYSDFSLAVFEAMSASIPVAIEVPKPAVAKPTVPKPTAPSLQKMEAPPARSAIPPATYPSIYFVPNLGQPLAPPDNNTVLPIR